jgi:uncharacterized membrane protein YdbT with pleckstrin-like domain
MSELIIRPSAKYALIGYVLGGIFFLVVAVAAFLQVLPPPGFSFLWLALPVTYLLSVAWKHLKLRLVKLIVASDRVRFESGFLSKDIRAVDMAKLSDVRVEQSIQQRLMGVGTLTIETMAQGRIVLENIDRPQWVADQLLERSRPSVRNASA